MNEDLLKSLGRALAEEHDGSSAAPNATRARILAELREKKQKRGARFLWFPALALFLGSSAWAMGSGVWPSFWADEAESTAAAGVEAPFEAPRAAAVSRSSAAPTETEELPEATVNEERAEEPLTSPTSSESAPAAQPASSARSANPPLVTASASAPAAPARGGASSPGQQDLSLELYRAAHESHFRASDCAAAERGYAEYLAAAPEGTFALEARYNRGVCLARLGRVEAARQALTPFQSGTFGDYRRHEAQRLLEALTGAKD